MKTMIRRVIDPQEQARQENADAMAQKNADIIEYIAMMTDVDIPTENEMEDGENE